MKRYRLLVVVEPEEEAMTLFLGDIDFAFFVFLEEIGLLIGRNLLVRFLIDSGRFLLALLFLLARYLGNDLL